MIPCPLSAASGLVRYTYKQTSVLRPRRSAMGPRRGRGATRHSIASFAIVNSVAGNLRPNALAAMRLITISILVDQVTGRTAGLAALRMPIKVGSSDFVLGGHFHFHPNF